VKIIDQSYEILTSTEDLESIPRMIEMAGRTCYKSEDKITNASAPKFCKMLIKRGHEAMVEHGNITVRFITDRGVTHELVRHRIASFAQESTRYVNYKDSNMEFIRPVFDWAPSIPVPKNPMVKFNLWATAMGQAENYYKGLSECGCSPQEARSVLPNSLKTEIVVTANIREWRQIFKLRTATGAHPQIRELMIPLLEHLQGLLPELFEDIEGR